MLAAFQCLHTMLTQTSVCLQYPISVSDGKVTSVHSAAIKWEPRAAALIERFANYSRGAPSAAAYAIAQAERRERGHDANWLTMKHIIFPCQDLGAVHWRLIVIHVEERVVSFYDPFASKDTAGDCAAVLQWLQHSIAQYPDRAVARHPRATDFTAYPGQAQSKTAAMDPGRPIAQGWRLNLQAMPAALVRPLVILARFAVIVMQCPDNARQQHQWFATAAWCAWIASSSPDVCAANPAHVVRNWHLPRHTARCLLPCAV